MSKKRSNSYRKEIENELKSKMEYSNLSPKEWKRVRKRVEEVEKIDPKVFIRLPKRIKDQFSKKQSLEVSENNPFVNMFKLRDMNSAELKESFSKYKNSTEMKQSSLHFRKFRDFLKNEVSRLQKFIYDEKVESEVREEALEKTQIIENYLLNQRNQVIYSPFFHQHEDHSKISPLFLKDGSIRKFKLPDSPEKKRRRRNEKKKRKNSTPSRLFDYEKTHQLALDTANNKRIRSHSAPSSPSQRRNRSRQRRSSQQQQQKQKQEEVKTFLLKDSEPVHTIFLVDRSSSMSEDDLLPETYDFVRNSIKHRNRLGLVLEAVQMYIEDRMLSTSGTKLNEKGEEIEDIVSFVEFNNGSNIIFENETISLDLIQDHCMKVYPRGYTQMVSGFEKVFDIVDRYYTNESDTHNFVILIFTDGVDDEKSRERILGGYLEEKMKLYEKLSVHSVSFEPTKLTKQYLKEVARIGKGKRFFATEKVHIIGGFKSIAQWSKKDETNDDDDDDATDDEFDFL